jgi:hypothetical protein
VAIALDDRDELFELICAKCSRVGSAAFVGRRGVERLATVRISVIGVTGARCGLSLICGPFAMRLFNKVIL